MEGIALQEMVKGHSSVFISVPLVFQPAPTKPNSSSPEEHGSYGPAHNPTSSPSSIDSRCVTAAGPILRSLSSSATHQRSQVSVALHKYSVDVAKELSFSISSAPLAAGTPIGSLIPLVQSLEAWKQLSSPSHWLLRTIPLGYAIQFAGLPPKLYASLR